MRGTPKLDHLQVFPQRSALFKQIHIPGSIKLKPRSSFTIPALGQPPLEKELQGGIHPPTKSSIGPSHPKDETVKEQRQMYP